MSLQMFRPVLGRFHFDFLIKKVVSEETDLTLVFLHRQHREDLQQGCVFLDYDRGVQEVKLVISVYGYARDIIKYPQGSFLSWKGPVSTFQEECSKSKEIFGHNAIRDFVWGREDTGKHVNLKEALDAVGFRYTEEVFRPRIKSKAFQISPKPKYKPERDPNQLRLI